MRHMVQVELTMICLDEDKRRLLERYAPSNERRLDTIKTLADAGIFVRVMAMPFVGTYEERDELMRVTFDHGARAFKSKGLNYFTYEDLLMDNVVRRVGRNEQVEQELLINSGEPVNGKARVLMPNFALPVKSIPQKWKELVKTNVDVARWGYSEMNEVDWEGIL
jgi:hypothetical protein